MDAQEAYTQALLSGAIRAEVHGRRLTISDETLSVTASGESRTYKGARPVVWKTFKTAWVKAWYKRRKDHARLAIKETMPEVKLSPEVALPEQ